MGHISIVFLYILGKLRHIDAMDYRRVKAKMRNASAKQLKAAGNIASGMSIKASMIDAGYSEVTAAQGLRAIPATVLALMPQESNLVDLGRALNPEQQEALVRGRLALNVLKGKDSGVASAYRLGQDKRVNMFTPEAQTGLVVLTVNALPEKDGKVPENE